MEKKQTTAPVPAGNQNVNESMLVFSNQTSFETSMRMAKCLSSSTIVPIAYQGDKGLANCIVALEMANRIGASPLMVMQNLYIVHGNPGWSSKFLIAALNTSGKFTTPLRYEYKGTPGTDQWGCRAFATDRFGSTLYGAWVTIDMAKKEGWYSKNGSKWPTMPELMMQYRAAAFFQRAYAPEISMGMQTAEEIQDVEWVEVPAEQALAQEVATNANAEVIGMDTTDPQPAPQAQAQGTQEASVEEYDETPAIFQ